MHRLQLSSKTRPHTISHESPIGRNINSQMSLSLSGTTNPTTGGISRIKFAITQHSAFTVRKFEFRAGRVKKKTFLHPSLLQRSLLDLHVRICPPGNVFFVRTGLESAPVVRTGQGFNSGSTHIQEAHNKCITG